MLNSIRDSLKIINTYIELLEMFPLQLLRNLSYESVKEALIFFKR